MIETSSDPGTGTAGSAGSGPEGTAPAPQPQRRAPRKLQALLVGTVIAVALGVFLFVGLGTGSGSGSSPGPVVAVGDPAPQFTLPSLTGGAPVNLDAIGKDRHRPVVLNFFASWCIPCQKETPLLARTADAEAAKGSVVRFVGVDVADPPANAIPFVKQAGLTYPIGTDADLRVTTVLYGLNGEPNTFFIDASGQVIGHIIGGVNASELQQWLHRLAGASG